MMEKFLAAAEVASMTGLTEGALSQLRYTGKGPTFLKPTARTVRYRESDVLAWLNASERKITSQVA